MAEHKITFTEPQVREALDRQDQLVDMNQDQIDAIVREPCVVYGDWKYVQSDWRVLDYDPNTVIEQWKPTKGTYYTNSHLPPELICPSSTYHDWFMMRDDVRLVVEEHFNRPFKIYIYEDDNYQYVIHQVDEYDGHGYPTFTINRHKHTI
jgi:hypothetical protein